MKKDMGMALFKPTIIMGEKKMEDRRQNKIEKMVGKDFVYKDRLEYNLINKIHPVLENKSFMIEHEYKNKVTELADVLDVLDKDTCFSN